MPAEVHCPQSVIAGQWIAAEAIPSGLVCISQLSHRVPRGPTRYYEEISGLSTVTPRLRSGLPKTLNCELQTES